MFASSTAATTLLVVVFSLLSLPAHHLCTSAEQLSEANMEFALKLYKQIRTVVGDGENIFLSPVSISTALAMLYAGARGESQQQMEEVLNFDNLDSSADVLEGFSALLDTFNDPTNNYTLSMANRLFGRAGYNFVDEYLLQTRDYYGAELEALNFTADPEVARHHINDWVATETRQKIKDLLPAGSINEMTALVLVNAIYFKGVWTIPFKPRDTEPHPFYLSDTKHIEMEMMNNKDHYSYSEVDELGCRVLQLPYAGEEVAMYIFIPNDKEGLQELEDKLTISKLQSSLDDDSFNKEKVKVRLPKFNMTFTVGLKDMLMKMGMKDVFVPEIADLSGINGKRDLFVSDAVHKAFVDVNEVGTEAAGATGIIIELTSAQIVPELYADRPFLFIIKEKTTNSILFMGSYAKPPEENPVVGRIGRLTQLPNSAGHFAVSLILLVTTRCLTIGQ